MCLGIPAIVTAITDRHLGMAQADCNGIRREINLSLLVLQGQPLEALVGRWVLLHVGFAMALIDAEEAERTLQLLREADDDHYFQ